MHDDPPAPPTVPPPPDEILARFGREVRTAREARGLSRQRFAKRCGLSVSTVKNLEGGRGTHPRLETLIRLATGLDVALSDLVACVDPWLSDERRAEVGAAHVWLAALDPPGRDLVLALVRVLAHDPTRVAEGAVAYATYDWVAPFPQSIDRWLTHREADLAPWPALRTPRSARIPGLYAGPSTVSCASRRARASAPGERMTLDLTDGLYLG